MTMAGTVSGHVYRAALARAGLRPLRFHDLRHTFGTRVIGVADIRRVQEWVGHETCRRRCNTSTTSRVPKTPRSPARRWRRAPRASLAPLLSRATKYRVHANATATVAARDECRLNP